MSDNANTAKPAKTPPEIRRIWIMQQVQNNHIWPRPSEIMKKYSVSQRQSYYDLEAVTKKLASHINIERLRVQVFGRLERRVPKLEDRDLVRLALGFMPQKVEARVTGSQEITVKKSGMSLEEMISLVPPEQRSTVLNALRAAWDSTHPVRLET